MFHRPFRLWSSPEERHRAGSLWQLDGDLQPRTNLRRTLRRMPKDGITGTGGHRSIWRIFAGLERTKLAYTSKTNLSTKVLDVVQFGGPGRVRTYDRSVMSRLLCH